MQLSVNGSPVYAYTGSRAFDRSLPSIVFVHGAANDHSVWALQSRYFAHHGRNVLAVDLPGHGRSGAAPLASVADIADWIVELLDAAGIDRADVVGHSLGALATLDAAARYPSRIGRMALLGPAVPMPVADALLDAAKRDDPVAFELITGWSFSPGHLLGGNRLPGVWMTGSAMRLMQRLHPGVLHTDLSACHSYERGLAMAAQVACPSLIVLGQRDLMAPPANAKALIATLRAARVIVLPDCGHSLMAEAPDDVLDALRDFLA